MGRLLNWPTDLYWERQQILAGPRTVGASQTTSTVGFNQTTQSPFGSWVIQLDFPRLQEKAYRAYRGWVAGMQGGANATRFTMVDFHGAITLNPDGTERPRLIGFDEGFGFEERNHPFQFPATLVRVASPSAQGDTIIHLEQEEWEPQLQVGDYIGFVPFHFGKYLITQDMGEGRYRVTLPLRTSIDENTYATLFPTLAMRLTSEDAAPVGRTTAQSDALSVTLTEVFHDDVLEFFND